MNLAEIRGFCSERGIPYRIVADIPERKGKGDEGHPSPLWKRWRKSPPLITRSGDVECRGRSAVMRGIIGDTQRRMRARLSMAIALFAGLLLPASAFAQTQLVPVATGLVNPVFVTGARDGTNRLFIVEQAGTIRVMPIGGSGMSLFLDIRSRVRSGGEQGLLGLAFHPSYSSNRRFFVYYTRAADGAIVIAEYAASAANREVADATERVLLTIPHPSFSNHNGGMVAFGPDGYLYIGVGDGGSGNDPPNNAQNRNALLGKLLRIDVNGQSGSLPYAIPPSNPFFGSIDGRDEIFAYGLRNPWRFAFDRLTNQLWIADVGQGDREEVNTPIQNGGNYGWRVYEGSACTNTDPALCSPSELPLSGLRIQPHGRPLLDHRRLRLPRLAQFASRRAVRLRRLLQRRDLYVERHRAAPGARHDAQHLLLRRRRCR